MMETINKNNLYIKDSPIEGLGLYTKVDINENTFLAIGNRIKYQKKR